MADSLTALTEADHGQVPADSIHGTYVEARHTLEALRAVGIDYDEVMRDLEAEGVAKNSTPPGIRSART